MKSVIINQVRTFLRDGATVFFTLFFPSICTFFLGTFLEKIEVSDYTVGEVRIAYCTENSNEFSAEAFEEFIKGMEKDGLFTAEKVSAEKAKSVSEEYSAAVMLEDFDITIYNGSDRVQNRTVKAIFDGYAQMTDSYMSVITVNPLAAANIGGDVGDGYVKQKDLGTSRSMMDYYAVSMAVMIVFFGSCMAGASVYNDEHNNCTIDRLTVSPVSKTKVYFGKIIGSMPMAVSQVAAIMLVSVLLFGAHYCNTLGGNLLLAAMLICCSLAALAVGVLFNLCLPKVPTQAVLMPVIWIMLFYSGAFAKDMHIDGFSEILPPYVINQAAFDLTVFSRPEKALRVTAYALAIFAAAALIGAVKVNVRRKGK